MTTEDIWIAPAQLFDGARVLTGAGLRLTGGRSVEVAERAPKGAVALPGLLTPGFVDLQVNGGGGVMLNSDPTRGGMARIAEAHRGVGTVAILPTLISDGPDLMDRVVTAAIAARGDRGIAGVHLEGPHLAPVKRGTHDAEVMRRFDERTMRAVEELRRAEVPVMLTVAPEMIRPDEIAALAALGVVVSLGHSAASADEARAAMAAGAGAVTHLFNAMSQMTHRAPGLVGAAINSDVYCGIICDGHHVADEMVGLALRARPRGDRTFLVSDAMATVGGPDRFDLYGETITLKDGRLVNREGSLAGAHVTLVDSVRRLVTTIGVDPAAALRMVTSIPAACIRQPALGRITARHLADLIVLKADLTLAGSLEDILSRDAMVDVAS